MNKLLYRPKEAAQLLGIGRDKLYDLMRSGRLTAVTRNCPETAM
ncbi:MAG: helix-turn-helix domain-containing protein [Streptosporangiaceae bacterium]